jgi:hypothetical protein
MRGVFRLVLAAQTESHLGRQAPQRLAGRVYNIPVALDALRARKNRLHLNPLEGRYGKGRKF